MNICWAVDIIFIVTKCIQSAHLRNGCYFLCTNVFEVTTTAFVKHCILKVVNSRMADAD